MLSIPLDASTKLGEVRQAANKAACFLSFFQASSYTMGMPLLMETPHRYLLNFNTFPSRNCAINRIFATNK